MMKKKRMDLSNRCLLVICMICLWTFPAWAQTTVTGTVNDAAGNALPGVTVQLKGTTVATTTSGNGTFQINAPSTGTITFSMIGYGTQEVNINNRTSLFVILESESELVEEVVVVGYNVVKKSDLTGSVVSVSSEDITAMPVQNPLQALQGRAAGLDVTSNERPGEMGSIRVRGERSLLASNSPLYVVDGVPLSSGGIEFLNPKDIEAIDVLKDASATAIYGSRGANGVIIVTTKRGVAGRTTLNYSVTSTVENLTDRTKMMDADQYIDFRRDAYRFIGQYPDAPNKERDEEIFGGDPYAWENVEKGWANGQWDGSLVPTTDWSSYVTKTGVTHDHILSASGGTEKLQAYGSVGYLKQDGTQKGQDYERFSGKLTIDIKPKDWFKMGAVLNTTLGDQNYGYQTSNATGPGNLYAAARGMLPYAVPYDNDGNRINLPGGDVNILNPVEEPYFNVNERRVWRNFGNIYAEVEPIKGLRYRVNFGPDYYHNRNGRFAGANSVNRGGGEPGSTSEARLDQTTRFSWTLDNLIYYDRSFDKHNMGLTLLQSATYNRTETQGMTANDLPWESQKWYQMNSVDQLQGFNSNLVETQLTSYMVRGNYDFDGKYLFTGSLRWDGASQLADGNKWDLFPSAAVAWRLDRESFLEDLGWINSLKARVGFGVTGNSAVDPYMTLGILTPLYYSWGNIVEDGYVLSDPSLRDPLPMPNRALGWEKTAQINYGVDFALFNNRLSGSIDYFTSRTTDLLMNRAIPSVLGYVSTWDNIGISANRGIDVTLNTVNISNENFSWESTVNFTHSIDRIVELQNGKLDDVGNSFFIGRRIGVYYDFVKEGIWQDTPEDLAEIAKFNENGHEFRPGTIRVKDVNGDYRINANDDREIRGHSAPNWNFGFNNSFSYKNFDLNFFIYGRMGFTIESGAESLQGRYAQRVLDYWMPDNPTNDYPAPNYNSASGDPYRSAMNYQDGSFIKLRNVSLGYTLPQHYTDRIKLANLRIYAQVMNPGLLYSKVDWVDPDTNNSFFNRGFVFGLNVGF
ncbi:SusC/RagA family TonB-linked outer membrane protein [Sphingobacterium sp. FBM7-1]|uniref:SusC/RagA family TonB-linked outer membrane protein n=1 Tax=Sphingobacterium sp. FBM7-1 TaxID=2886688 RepID=UPI001D0F7917|nr:TonB-dependent receptor [Sphingobacterium sp. FBM7-1]MCC2598965.1 TonB-dependent receptor [Sphingobacterium sp. FBM7-1]